MELKNLKPGRYIVSYWRLPRTSAAPAAWQYVENSMDIGPDTIQTFCGAVRGAGTVVWNGRSEHR